MDVLKQKFHLGFEKEHIYHASHTNYTRERGLDWCAEDVCESTRTSIVLPLEWWLNYRQEDPLVWDIILP